MYEMEINNLLAMTKLPHFAVKKLYFKLSFNKKMGNRGPLFFQINFDQKDLGGLPWGFVQEVFVWRLCPGILYRGGGGGGGCPTTL